ncbi:MAG: histidinol dehydrogenase, partial [bacterium]
MIQYLKEGRSAADAKADQSKVRQTVEHILAEIESRGDAAVRELAQKFDGWTRPNFRLSPDEIQAALEEVPEST